MVLVTVTWAVVMMMTMMMPMAMAMMVMRVIVVLLGLFPWAMGYLAMRLESICCTKFAGDAPRSQEPQLHVHETCDGRAFLSNYNTVFSAQRFKGVKLSILAMRSASLSYQLLVGLRADASCLSAEED